MAGPAQQTYANHARFLPALHFFAVPVLAVNVVVALVPALRAPSLLSFWYVLVAIALCTAVFLSRIMALTAQDRVIRLEQKLRMLRVLPSDMHADIDQLTRQQFVALRFASDAELPDLVRRCRAGAFENGKAIKQAIRDWQPDLLRV